MESVVHNNGSLVPHIILNEEMFVNEFDQKNCIFTENQKPHSGLYSGMR
jgi:hypothetical protein